MRLPAKPISVYLRSVTILFATAAVVSGCASGQKKNAIGVVPASAPIQISALGSIEEEAAKAQQQKVSSSGKSIVTASLAPKKKRKNLFSRSKKTELEKLPLPDFESEIITNSISTKPVSYPATSSTNTFSSKKGSYTLSQVVGTTLDSNPDVNIANAQEEDAAIGIKVEKTGLFPVVNFQTSTGFENTYAPTSSTKGVNRREVSLQVEHTLYSFGKGRNAVKRKESLHASAVNRRLDKSEEIALEVIRTYLAVLEQSDLASAAKRNVKAHQDMAKLVRLSEEEGNSTVADVKRVETRLDRAKSVVLDIDDGLQSAINAFRRIADMDPHKLKRPKVLSAKIPNLYKANIEDMAEENPRLHSFKEDKNSLIDQLKQQKGANLPELFASAQANYKYNTGGETGSNSDMRGMLGMRFKVYDAGKGRYIKEQISARLTEADYRIQKVYREVIESLKQNSQTLKSAQKKSEFLGDSLNSAKKVMSLYKEQFKAGKRTPFELLDAQQDLYNAESDAIKNRFSAALATYEHLRLRGKLVDHFTLN